MRNSIKKFKGIILLLWLIMILILGCMSVVSVYAKSSQKEIIVSDKSDSVLIHDYVYPGMDKIKNSDGWLYTYTVDGQNFSSEKSEDDAFLKGIFWQYEHGLKTLEEIEFEYGLYTSRGLLYTPSIESNSTDYMINSTSSDGVGGRVEWQPNNETSYLPLKYMRVELWYVYYDSSSPTPITEGKGKSIGYFNQLEHHGDKRIKEYNMNEILTKKERTEITDKIGEKVIDFRDSSLRVIMEWITGKSVNQLKKNQYGELANLTNSEREIVFDLISYTITATIYDFLEMIEDNEDWMKLLVKHNGTEYDLCKVSEKMGSEIADDSSDGWISKFSKEGRFIL